MTFLEVNISMADTSNLSKFLTDVAQAIRDKKGSDAMIPAKNFDTEIADITSGVDTSDATATSMDLPRGVTAYARGEKITGVLDKYENTELMQSYGGYVNQGSVVEIQSTPHEGNPSLYGKGVVVSIMVPKEENGLVAENIAEGVNIFGVEGTASAGTDTSDATATANDIVQGKSAYVDGSKIEGALQKGLLNNDLMMNGLMFSDTNVTLSYEFPETKVIESGDGFWPTIGFSEIANEQGVTSDMIVEGNRILGIDGTAKIGSGETGVKLFETIDEMQADAEAKEGDLALVYRNELQPITVDSRFSKAVFPETVVLPSAMIDYADLMFRAVDDSIMFDCWGQLDSSYFMMDCYTETGNVRIQYESSDGITYNRTRLEGDGVDGNSVDFGTEIYYAQSEMWNDAISYFIQAGGMYFEGLFEYAVNYKDQTRVQLPDTNDMTVTPSGVENNYTITWGGNYCSKVLDKNKLINLAIKMSSELNTSSSAVVTAVYLGPNDDVYSLWLKPESSSESTYPSASAGISFNSDGTVFGFAVNDNSNKNYTLMVYKCDLENCTYVLEKELPPTLRLSEYWLHYPLELKSTVILVSTNANSFGALTSVYVNLGDSSFTTTMDETFKDVYVYEDVYVYAKNQLSLSSSDKLLSNEIGYGRNGIVVGDGSIYENLDSNAVNSTVLKLDESLVVSKSEYGYDGWIRGVDSTQQMVSYSENADGDAYVVHINDTEMVPNLVQSVKYDENTVIGVHYVYGGKVFTAYKYEYDTNTLTSLGSLDTVWYDYNGGMIAIDDAKENVYFGARYTMNNKTHLVCYKIDLQNNTFTQLCDHVKDAYEDLRTDTSGIISPKQQAAYVDTGKGVIKYNFDGTSSVMISKSSYNYNTSGKSNVFNTTKYLPVDIDSTESITDDNEDITALYDVETESLTNIKWPDTNTGAMIAWSIGDTTYIYRSVDQTLNLIRNDEIVETIASPFGSSTTATYGVFPTNEPFIYENKIIVQPYNTYLFDLDTHGAEKLTTILTGASTKLLSKNGKNMDVSYNGIGKVRFWHIDIRTDNTGEFLAFKTSEGKYYLRKYEYDYLGEYGCLPSVKNSISPVEYIEAVDVTYGILGIEPPDAVDGIVVAYENSVLKQVTILNTLKPDPASISSFGDANFGYVSFVSELVPGTCTIDYFADSQFWGNTDTELVGYVNDSVEIRRKLTEANTYHYYWSYNNIYARMLNAYTSPVDLTIDQLTLFVTDIIVELS